MTDEPGTPWDDTPEPDGTQTPDEISKIVDDVELTNKAGYQLKAVLNAWDAGYPMEEIADKFGYPSVGHARRAIEQAVAASNSDTLDTDVLRAQAQRVLDRYHTVCFEAVFQGPEVPVDQRTPLVEKGAWIALGLKLMDRKIKLLGLDAPVQIAVTASQSDIEKWATMIAIAHGAPDVDETDPLALEPGHHPDEVELEIPPEHDDAA